jgi:hypothetical protein
MASNLSTQLGNQSYKPNYTTNKQKEEQTVLSMCFFADFFPPSALWKFLRVDAQRIMDMAL